MSTESSQRLQMVFWGRRLPMGIFIGGMALTGLSGFTVGTASAFWGAVTFGFPLTAWAIWVWCFSCRLRVDEIGVSITWVLPWRYRRPWDQITGFTQVSQTGSIPLIPFTNLQIEQVARRPRNCGEVGYLDNASGRARLQELVVQLNQMRVGRHANE